METLGEYMTEEDFSGKTNEEKINAIATFVIDLENEVYD